MPNPSPSEIRVEAAEEVATISADAEFQKLFGGLPEVTAEHLRSLHRTADRLELDADYQADYWKGRFTTSILGAMHDRNVSSSRLAQLWGKTRQYVSKLFNEDKRVNVTIETMTKLASLLKHRIEIRLIDLDPPLRFVGSVPSQHLTPWPDSEDSLSTLNPSTFSTDLYELYCDKGGR